MTFFKPYRDESRKNWGNTDSGNLTIQQINTGALLRIADASEAMAKNHNDLISTVAYWRGRAERAEQCSARLARTVAALRGVITKMRRKHVLTSHGEDLRHD